ncbi:MAG: glycosyltransferase family 2 protein [Deltaproteobacteria bacterium]|nr:glycosyltransferase family 2 protein [Deltaproteobacteria bacterium]MBN2674448.1 glycosyltransferase family 2 protein [Deltaproteobacteria bacterium]
MWNLFFNITLLSNGTTVEKWHPLADDSGYELHRRFYSGWYVFELQVDADEPDTAKLYLDLGNGFRDDHVVEISFHSPRLRKRFFLMPPRCRAIRLVPAQVNASYTMRHFKLRRVTRGFAFRRILRRMQRADVYMPAGAAPKELMSLYAQLFQPVARVDYSYYVKEIEPRQWCAGVKNVTTVISLYMSLHRADSARVERTVHSILQQTYPHWELWFTGAASIETSLRARCEEYTVNSRRIRFLSEEAGDDRQPLSSKTSVLGTGEYIVRIDVGDTLAPQALNELIHVAATHSDSRIIYSDEDRIDVEGARHSPHFKPDWNEYLLLSQNYISRLCAFRRELIESVAGERAAVGNGRAYDLLLRCVKACAGKGIHHVDKVLVHRHEYPVENENFVQGAESNDATADILALTDYLSDIPSAEVVPVDRANTYRVIWPVPEPSPQVTLIVPARNERDMTRRAINSILQKTDYPNYDILLIDNRSDDKNTLAYFASLASHPRVRVVNYPHEFNFAAINNFAVQQAEGDIVGLLNNDIEIRQGDWLREMVSHAAQSGVGCVGAKLVYPDGRIQHGGVILGIGKVAGHSHKYYREDHPGYFGRLLCVQNMTAVTAAAMLVRKSVYLEVGGMDAENLKVAYNDVDFCLKVIENGYRNVWTPHAVLIHHESVSRGLDDDDEKQTRFAEETAYMLQKWGARLRHDPCYNRNLSHRFEDFSLNTDPDPL